MADGSQPEKRLKLGNSNNGEQDEIRKLKKVVRELEESLASKNQNLLEMEQSKHKAEREKVKVKKENEKLEREKNYFEEKYMKLEEDKNKIEEKLQKLVECPVCLTLPREGPVPCCVKGHFVCSPCLGKLRKENKLDCPTCREPFGEGKSLLAFAVAEEVQHECSHQGCTKTTPFDEIVQHEKDCKWRLILCPGDGLNCTARIPFCKVEDHAQECENCDWPPIKIPEGGIVFTRGDNDGVGVVWDTDLIQFEGGQLFFCRMFRKNGHFTVDVAMKGCLEECKGFVIEASILNGNSVEFEAAVKTSFPPRPLKEDNKPGFCLTVPQELMSGVCKYNAELAEYDIKVLVKVIKLG